MDFTTQDVLNNFELLIFNIKDQSDYSVFESNIETFLKLPNQFVLVLLDIIESNDCDCSIRETSLDFLVKYCAYGTESIFSELSSETHLVIRQKLEDLIEILLINITQEKEVDSIQLSLFKKVCQTFGILIENLGFEFFSKTSEIIEILCCCDTHEDIRLIGFESITQFAPRLNDDNDMLNICCSLVVDSLNNENIPEVIVCSIKAWCAITSHINGREQIDLLSSLMDRVLELLDMCLHVEVDPDDSNDLEIKEEAEKQACIIISELNELANARMRAVKPYLVHIVSKMLDIMESSNLEASDPNYLGLMTAQSAIQFVLDLLETIPERMIQIPNFVNRVIGWLLSQMIKTPEDEKWETKRELTLEDDEKLAPVFFADVAIGRFALKVPGQILLNSLSEYVEPLLSADEWNQRIGGINALSACTEGLIANCIPLELLEGLTATILEMMNDDHKRVRHVAIHCMSEFITNFPDFVDMFGDAFLEAGLGRRETETVEKNLAPLADAFVLLLETAEDSYIVEDYKDELVDFALDLLNREASWVVQSGLNLFAAIAICLKEDFSEYYEDVAEMLQELLNSIGADDSSLDQDQKLLRSVIYDVWSLIGFHTKNDTFKAHSHDIMVAVTNLKTNLSTDDPLNETYFVLFSRVASVLGNEIGDLLDSFMDSALPILQEPEDIKYQTITDINEFEIAADEPGYVTFLSGDQKFSYNRSQAEEKAAICRALATVVSVAEHAFSLYLSDTLSICIQMFKTNFVELLPDVLTLASSLMGLVKLLNEDDDVETREQQLSIFADMFNSFIKAFLQVFLNLKANKEGELIPAKSDFVFDFSWLSDANVAMKSFLNIVSCYSPYLNRQNYVEIFSMMNMILEHVKELRENTEEEIDDEYLAEDEFAEYQLLLGIGITIGHMMRHLGMNNIDLLLSFFENDIFQYFTGINKENVHDDDENGTVSQDDSSFELGERMLDAQFYLSVIDDMIINFHETDLINEAIELALPIALTRFLSFADDDTDHLSLDQTIAYFLNLCAQYKFSLVEAYVLDVYKKAFSLLEGGNFDVTNAGEFRDNLLSLLIHILYSSPSEIFGDSLSEEWIKVVQFLPLTKDFLEANTLFKLFIELIENNYGPVCQQSEVTMKILVCFIDSLHSKFLSEELNSRIRTIFINVFSDAEGLLNSFANELTKKSQKKLQNLLE
eukprot:TRINITY_DN2862_c1_g2_i1.p1 TRINITY_DN2862_c1_g2~~TRINITY_DN2862_c1_g2_i1.p1  ORF type:complete len:1185 (-),score=394.41 TRINITY_DN2862_c1_g2_i1:147-3701(-)